MDAASIEALDRAIDKDVYGIKFKSRPGTIERLNELLRVTNLYDLIIGKGKRINLTQQMQRLIVETNEYRGRRFADLSAAEQKKIMLLNRLLLRALYGAPSRASWLVPVEINLPTSRVTEYLYVWEFDKGKLLLVKEWKGKYSADIYVPTAEEWLALDEITRDELQKLIAKPIAKFKPRKKKK